MRHSKHGLILAPRLTPTVAQVTILRLVYPGIKKDERHSMNLSGIRLRILFVTAFVITIYPSTAWAYLDPGTGSMLLQMVVAGFLGAVAMIATFWRSFKSKVNRILGRESQAETEESE